MYKGSDGQVIPKWHYGVIAEKCCHIDLGQFHTYAMRLTGPAHMEILYDVSVCKETIVRMAALFNQHQLSLCHFHDAVEDLII